MPAAYPVTATETSPQVAAAAYSTRRVVRMLPQIPAALIPQVAQCSRRVDQTLTRGEMAVIFSVATRTVARWEITYGLMPVRTNARVLRYKLVDVIGLVALGATINRPAAEALGLNTSALLSLAGAVGPQPSNAIKSGVVQHVVFIAETEADRELLRVRADKTLGPILQKIIRGLTAADTSNP